ncbi:hypothetical protein [Halorussus halophilus]|uniref:hypothetical protein n=1 Tax=Halorussus halophilus TaxID=2650975 RepID=UPI0013013496|nr:hypothetical protein [Halorussus halophilus]
MRRFALLAGLLVVGATAVATSTASPGPEPALVTAGAGVLGAGVVGVAVEGVGTFGSSSEIDRFVVALGSGALFVRVAAVHVVARPLRYDGVALTALGVLTVGVVVGYRAAALTALGVLTVGVVVGYRAAALTALGVLTVGVVVGYRAADDALDGLRQGLLACGLGGVLCVLFVAYNVVRLDALTAFDALVAGSGVVLPVVFGLFGAVSGVAGWWLADYLSAPDALA